MPSTTSTDAPSDAMPSMRASAVPVGTKMWQAYPSSRAMRATARPWLPSVAATSVSGPSGTRAARSSSSDENAGSPPRRSARSREIAHDAPRILNDGRSSRLDSSFTHTRARPSSAASAGASTSGVVAYPGRRRWNARGLSPTAATGGVGTRPGFA